MFVNNVVSVLNDRKMNKRILIVDDEPSLLKIYKKFLENLGYTVLTTNVSSEAIKLAQNYNERIDLLITDVIMPEMNGKDLSLKILEYQPDLPCLFISGYTAEFLAPQNILDSDTILLEKPFKISDLAEKVRELLDE